jgi:Ankyrin repeats (3 copies)
VLQIKQLSLFLFFLFSAPITWAANPIKSYFAAYDAFIASTPAEHFLKSWATAKRPEAFEYLNSKATPDACDEMLLTMLPAGHAGELIIRIVCNTGSAINYIAAVPSKKHVTSQPVDAQRWKFFLSSADQWKPAPFRGVAARANQLDAAAAKVFEGYLGTVATYAKGQWNIVALRGWEVFGHPDDLNASIFSRWQLAEFVLLGGDVAGAVAQHKETQKVQTESAEHSALWLSIRDDKRVEFSQQLRAPKSLTRSHPEMYRLVAWAMENKRYAMAAEIFSTGTPLRENGEPHPNLVAALSDGPSKSLDEFRTVLSNTKLPSLTGKASIDDLALQLQAAIASAKEAQRLAYEKSTEGSRLIAQNAERVRNDPKLAFAESFGNETLASALAGRHVIASQRNKSGENLLFFTLAEEKFALAALELIKDGIDAATPSTSHRVTPLMLAAGNSTRAVVQAILALTANKANVNATSADGSTALMWATLAGKEDNVKALLAAGAAANLKDLKGATAIDFAKQQRFASILALLEARK